ncbi:MAG: hypothetical protein GQ544_04790 [Candidatus Aminicenantes bacterium]|nr:hypothetical protein [Candidatus Aminicenantes bacterium]
MSVFRLFALFIAVCLGFASGSGFVEEGLSSEIWMGVYINGVKVGFSHFQEEKVNRDGKELIKTTNESRMSISRLGGNPVELVTIEESLYTADEKPLESRLRTRMSQTEIMILAQIEPEKIRFYLEGELVKEVAYTEEFYLGVPLDKLMRQDGLVPGKSFKLKILDPLVYGLSDCHVSIVAEEETLILGEKMKLWHVRSELSSVIPVVVEEWLDEKGEVYKSVTEAGFLSTTSIRMSKEKALEAGSLNFDIAFSSIILSNRDLGDPLQVRSMTVRLSGLPVDKLKGFPWDQVSQKILQEENDHIVIKTTSKLVLEEEAPVLPLSTDALAQALTSTVFCQSDDADITALARKIVGEEKNSWRAAKKIAEWINLNLTPNYDVGFASAKEIMQNREGDCSEHAVLFVALCRAVGLPARAAIGVMYADGFFAYHMWPEVYVGDWVSLDPKWLARDEDSGDYCTDATHIKFGHSYLDENMYQEILTSTSQIIGRLKLEILDYSR